MSPFWEATITVSDAERLRAAGHTVTLADQQVPLVYDFNAMLLLEKEWGSLPAISERLLWPADGLLASVQSFLAAGLAHLGITAEQVRQTILLGELKNYQHAVQSAIAEAFPTSEGKAEGGETTGSTGTGSTTSPPSDTAEPTASSGG